MTTFSDMLVAARTIYGEARGESDQGKIAVAWVIRNRHESGKWFGEGTVGDVCRKREQFSCWNPDDPNRARIEALTPDDPMLQTCLWAALSVFCDKTADPTCGATHYQVTGTDAAWANGKVPVCTIGHHQFFRGIL